MSEKITDLMKALEAKQAEAATKYEGFEKVKAETLELGEALLSKEHEAEFTALDEASKAYDTVCDDVNAMQEKVNRLVEIDGSNAPAMPLVPGARDDGDEKIESLADRWFASKAYAHLKNIGATRDGNTKIDGTPAFEVIRRDDIKATLMETSTYPSQNFRRPGIVPALVAQPDIMDIVNVIPTDKETVEWVYESTFTNNAVETAEGSAAGEGVEAFTTSSISCRWIPFSIPSTKQLLSDEPRMRSWIEERLPRGIRVRLSSQLISGNGSAPNIKGILNWSGILTQDMGTNSVADVVHKAKTKIMVQTIGNHIADTLLLHPNDWERLVLSKATTGGDYLFGGPVREGLTSVWGLLPVIHTHVTEGNPVVCDRSVLELYVKDGITLSVSNSHSDFFTKGKVMWLAEGRFGFLITQAKAVCQITDFNS